jgi:hypothetical protein
MAKIRVVVSTNKIGSECERVFEVDDETPDSEIDDFAQETMFEMINWNREKA